MPNGIQGQGPGTQGGRRYTADSAGSSAQGTQQLHGQGYTPQHPPAGPDGSSWGSSGSEVRAAIGEVRVRLLALQPRSRTSAAVYAVVRCGPHWVRTNDVPISSFPAVGAAVGTAGGLQTGLSSGLVTNYTSSGGSAAAVMLDVRGEQEGGCMAGMLPVKWEVSHI
jgi:hypothetical protein